MLTGVLGLAHVFDKVDDLLFMSDGFFGHPLKVLAICKQNLQDLCKENDDQLKLATVRLQHNSTARVQVAVISQGCIRHIPGNSIGTNFCQLPFSRRRHPFPGIGREKKTIGQEKTPMSF